MDINRVYKDNLVKQGYLIIDVRSPKEYADDHINGSINLPVLNNDEYEKIGLLYKSKSGFDAKKLGAQWVMQNISRHLREVLHKYDKNKKILFYCKRGGNRSFSFSIICSKIGWNCDVIDGGYKSYRRFIIDSIAEFSQGSKFFVIAGKTGNGKTKILNILEERGLQTIDFEGLACHRGSILGHLVDQVQPSQKLFESKIFEDIKEFDKDEFVFVESESAKIGRLTIPRPIFSSIYNSKLIKINNKVEFRIKFLIDEYQNLIQDHKPLFRLIEILKSRISKDEVAQIENAISEKKFQNLARYLLHYHYDNAYNISMSKRKGEIVKEFNFSCDVENAIEHVCNNIISNEAFLRG